MCIYPMDSPGGYQLVGRTLPIWNTWGRVEPFSPDTPWLLRIFDQVRLNSVVYKGRKAPGGGGGGAGTEGPVFVCCTMQRSRGLMLLPALLLLLHVQ